MYVIKYKANKGIVVVVTHFESLYGRTDCRAGVRYWRHNQFSLFNRFPIAIAKEASPRASRARKLRYENVELRILILIHTCVHSGKENIAEKPCRVTLRDIFSFFLFTTV